MAYDVALIKNKIFPKGIFGALFCFFIPENINQSEFELDKNISKADQPVFLIGFPRSGTTLLDTILRTHNLIDVIEEKPIVDKLLKEIEKNTGSSFSNLEKIEELEIKNLKDLYNKERQNYVKFDKDKIYIDKFPLNIVYLAEINKIFPNARYILAVRNPRDSVLSCFMQSFTPNDAMSNMFNINERSKMIFRKTYLNFQTCCSKKKHF